MKKYILKEDYGFITEKDGMFVHHFIDGSKQSCTKKEILAYGGVEEKYKHIKYLIHARDFREKYWADFQKNGFIRTPLFNRVITIFWY